MRLLSTKSDRTGGDMTARAGFHGPQRPVAPLKSYGRERTRGHPPAPKTENGFKTNHVRVQTDRKRLESRCGIQGGNDAAYTHTIAGAGTSGESS